jgi:putative ABC transport system permease protein
MAYLHLALRRTLRRPAFSAVVIALLAGAVGINATVFAVLNAVAFSELPYPQSDRLVEIRLAQRGCEYCSRETVPTPILDEWQRSVRSVEQWGATHSIATGFALGDTKREVRAGAITPATLTLLGARMQLGRAFIEEDDRRGGPRSVVLAAEFWRREFNSDRDVIGRFIQLNDTPFEVIGVIDRSFVWPFGGDGPDVLTTPNAVIAEPDRSRAIIIARLAPDATVARLNAELAQSAGPLIDQFLGRGDELRASAIPLSRSLAFGRGIELAIMQLLALVVLAVACANVAGLLIARQQAERHLIGMRVVLGARMRDLIALPLLDVVPLVMVGTALGMALAARVAPFAGAYLGTAVPAWARVRVDATVIIATLVVAAVASVAIALVPARELFRTELRSWIQTSAQATAGTRSARARQQILVGAQIGISTTLLVIAGVLVVNLVRLNDGAVDSGRYGSLHAQQFAVPQQGDANAIAQRVVDRLRAVPGIAGVAFSRAVQSSARDASMLVEGASRSTASLQPIGIEVGPRFTTAPSSAIVAGRGFTDDEIRRGADNVIVVNEALAKWIGRDNALGRRVRLGDNEPWRAIIGVMRNAGNARGGRVAADRSQTTPTYWIPGLTNGLRSLAVSITTDGDAEALVSAAGRAIEEVAPRAVSVLLPNTGTLAARAEARMRTILLVVLACFALGLSVVGVGTLVAFSTGLRNREFGIRTAMGATAGMIAGEVVRDAIRMSAKGLLLAAVGTVGAYVAFIPMVYFNAKVFDWRVAAGAMVMMTLLIVAASVAPAVRAARLSPARVLRGD